MSTPSLNDIFEAGIDSLPELIAQRQGAPRFYAQVCLHFLRAEVRELASLAGQADEEFLRTACLLRLRIRERAFDSAALDCGKRLAATPSLWQGELSILVATLLTVYDRFEEAKPWFEKAADQLFAIGCRKKSLRARMNALVCESHVHPDRNLLSAYHDLFRSSLKKESRDLTVATTCLLNVSREFQRTGALLTAVRYCEKALKLCEFQFGSLSHHLLLVHRAHLFSQLGRYAEARVDLDFLRVTAFPEVQAAVALVQSELDGKDFATHPNLLPNWQERVDDGANERFTLSVLEERLINFLGTGPVERVDLLEHLYGTALSYETKLNRLKSLLTSLRKKTPDLVRYQNDRYFLSHEILNPLRAKRA